MIKVAAETLRGRRGFVRRTLKPYRKANGTLFTTLRSRKELVKQLVQLARQFFILAKEPRRYDVLFPRSRETHTHTHTRARAHAHTHTHTHTHTHAHTSSSSSAFANTGTGHRYSSSCPTIFSVGVCLGFAWQCLVCIVSHCFRKGWSQIGHFCTTLAMLPCL